MNRTFVAMGSGFAFLAVALGAFGTHSLRNRLNPASLQIWQTAVQYHLIHALGLILVGLVAAHCQHKAIEMAGRLLAVGIFIFSGSLYALALTGIQKLGAITPLGGLCFLVAWATLAYCASRKPD